MLLNNFVLNTAKFLNVFSEACEERLTTISDKIQNLDIILEILEAKLNSVPGLEYSSTDLPTAAPAPQSTSSQPPAHQSTSSQPPPPARASTESTSTSSVPPPPLGVRPSAPVEVVTETQIEISHVNSSVTAADHPDYAMYFKLIRLGVPAPVVKAKCAAAGLNPDAIDNPSMVISDTPAPPANQLTIPLSRRIFDKFDVDSSGSIDIQELQKMALEFGVYLAGDSLNVAMRTIDRNGNGSITYDEFVNWFKSSSFQSLKLDDVTLQRRNAAAKVFTKYDSDRSGAIDRMEFEGLFKEIRLLNLTQLTLDKCLEDMDMDGDGRIQFNEFVVWLDRH